MQTQDAPADIIFKLWPWIEANRNRLIGGLVALFVLVAAYSFITWQHEQKEVAAGEALTQLLATPASATSAGQTADALIKFAAQYPGTAAGKRAQLQGAAALFDAGRYADAQAEFQKYLASASAFGTLTATAQLGLASCLEAQGKTDLATAAYQKVIANDSATSPAGQSAKAALTRIQKLAAKPVTKS